MLLKSFVKKINIKNKLRSFAYSEGFQRVICMFIICYMKLVFYSSRKIYTNCEKPLAAIKNNESFIMAMWHNRLLLSPFISYKTKKVNSNHNIAALASKHGDGKFVAKIFNKFGSPIVSGSTRQKNNSERGISLSGLREIFTHLANGNSLAITPDGPRGPAQKINGKLLELAKISKISILPFSVSSSRYVRLKSWDSFYVPLPFSRLCYHFGDEIKVAEELANGIDLEHLHAIVEREITSTQEKSQFFAKIGNIC